MESVCRRLEGVAEALSQATNTLNPASSASRHDSRLSEELIQAASVLGSFPGAVTQRQAEDSRRVALDSHEPSRVSAQNPAAIRALDTEAFDYSDEDGDGACILDSRLIEQGEAEEEEEDDEDDDGQGQAGALVRDSYGRLR